MKTAQKAIPSPEGQRQLDALHQAVGKAMERKRRLGQYAVIWQNGKTVGIGEDAPDRASGHRQRQTS